MCVFKGRPLIALELMEVPMRAPVIWRYSFDGLIGILLKEENPSNNIRRGAPRKNSLKAKERGFKLASLWCFYLAILSGAWILNQLAFLS